MWRHARCRTSRHAICEGQFSFCPPPARFQIASTCAPFSQKCIRLRVEDDIFCLFVQSSQKLGQSNASKAAGYISPARRKKQFTDDSLVSFCSARSIPTCLSLEHVSTLESYTQEAVSRVESRRFTLPCAISVPAITRFFVFWLPLRYWQNVSCFRGWHITRNVTTKIRKYVFREDTKFC